MCPGKTTGDILDKQRGQLRGQQVYGGDCAGRLDPTAAGGVRAIGAFAGMARYRTRMCCHLEPLRCARLRTSSRGRRHPCGWVIRPAGSVPCRPALQCEVLPGHRVGCSERRSLGPARPRARCAEGLLAGEAEKRRGRGLRTRASRVPVRSPPAACSRAQKTSAGGVILPHSSTPGQRNLRFHCGSRDHQTLGPSSWKLGVT